VPSDVTAHRVINTVYCWLVAFLEQADDVHPKTQQRGNSVVVLLCCFNYQRYAAVDAGFMVQLCFVLVVLKLWAADTELPA
jgi:hypothetical protein